MTTQEKQALEREIWASAKRHLATGQLEAAQAALESLIQLAPRDVPARLELSGVLLGRGRRRAAVEQLLASIPMLPNDAALIAQLAWRLGMNGEINGARACVDHLETAPDPPSHVLVELAHLRWMLGEIPAARAHMDRAVASGIEASGEFYLDAMLHQFSGHVAEAEQRLLSCLERWPHHGDAAVILANLRRQKPESNHLELFRNSLAHVSKSCSSERERYLCAKFESAVFKVLDDLGEYTEAWAALERCNRLMRDLCPYDHAAESSLGDKLLNAAKLLDRVPSADPRAYEGPIPIFIVGLPRSGSTLLDRMLSSHSAVVSAGEISDFNQQLHWVTDVAAGGNAGLGQAVERAIDVDFQLLGARYLAQTQWRAQGRQFYIDKLPMNVRLVPFIRKALPHAPIVHLVREPMDVCYSNLKVMFGKASPYCYDIAALAHYHGQYLRLVRHWRSNMPAGMLDVSYSDLVRDPHGVMSRVFKYCGLPAEEACLHPERNEAAVATPSCLQVREPIHKDALGQWRRYARQLEPLQRMLGEQTEA